MNVLILGSEGILGSYLSKYLSASYFNIIEINRNNRNSVLNNIKNKNINVNTIVNCVALTNVDLCNANIELAFESNANYIKRFIEEINLSDIHFIQISTDQVYSGLGNHKEIDPLPVNVYGLTKLLGEEYSKKLFSTVLRINYLSKSTSKRRNSFTDWLYNSLKNKSNITLFEDIIFSPLHINDLCESIKTVINNPIKGVYNLGACESISKAKFGIEFAQGLSLSTKHVKLGNFSDMKDLVKRPNDMSMNIKLFEDTFKKKLPNINTCLNKITADYL